MTRSEMIKENVLLNLCMNDLVYLWNEYCSNDDCVYPMDYFNEYYQNDDPIEIARDCFNSPHFNPNDVWFSINGYGHPVSSDWADDFIEFDDLAAYISGEEWAFGFDDIQEILDEYDEDGTPRAEEE